MDTKARGPKMVHVADDASILIRGCKEPSTAEERVLVLHTALTALSTLIRSMRELDDFYGMEFNTQAKGLRPVHYRITVGDSPMIELVKDPPMLCLDCHAEQGVAIPAKCPHEPCE